jgi:hypothetical protein
MLIQQSKMTPKKAIRACCVQCLGMTTLLNMDYVRNCAGEDIKCAFFPYRLGKRPPIKVFREYCINDCMNGDQKLVADCIIEDCPIHPYRGGTNPARARGKLQGIALLNKSAKEGVERAFIDRKSTIDL